MMTTSAGATAVYRIKRSILALAILASFGTSPALQAEGDAEAGRQRAYTCLGCHGVIRYANVYPTYLVPLIAGQHQAYLISALKAYRSGERQHGTMQANAGSLSDQDIENIAAYFANMNN